MKIVLASSGGLDTSVILTSLKQNYDAEIIAFCADIGQEEELDGLTEKALRTGERDAALQAIDKAISLQRNDARTQPFYQETKARILAYFGDKDGALGVLSHLRQVSYEGGLFGPPLTRTLLRLDPDWDNLRGDPRFEKLCQEK